MAIVRTMYRPGVQEEYWFDTMDEFPKLPKETVPAMSYALCTKTGVLFIFNGTDWVEFGK